MSSNREKQSAGWSGDRVRFLSRGSQSREDVFRFQQARESAPANLASLRSATPRRCVARLMLNRWGVHTI
jgi:hypothetical protein